MERALLVNQRGWNGCFEREAFLIQYLMVHVVLSLSVQHVKCLRRLATRQQKLLNHAKRKLKVVLDHFQIIMNAKLKLKTLSACRIVACEGFFHFSLTF